MTSKLLPDELWQAVEGLLPPERPKPKGGRPRASDRAALLGILYLLKGGIAWELLPRVIDNGDEPVEMPSAMTCWRRLRDWQQLGLWRRLHQLLLE